MGALLDAVVRAQLEDDPYLDGASFANETVDAGTEVQFFELHGLELNHCALMGVDFAKTSFYDCTLVGCDLSNANLAEAYFARTRLVDCKLEGAQLNKAFLRTTRFERCMCRYTNWAEATLEGSRLIECDLRESFMNEVRLRKKMQFERCDFTRADFFRTSLNRIDLSTCSIAGIGVSDTHAELRGAFIAADQAVDLVGMLGVRVVDLDA